MQTQSSDKCILRAGFSLVEILVVVVIAAMITLAVLEVENVHIHLGNGRHGLPELAQFQRILVSAAAKEVPPPLLEQLDLGGRIAIPVDDQFGQTLMIGVRRSPSEVHWTKSVPCLWVPLVAGP